MSDRRSLLHIVKDAARRARNIKKMTDPREIGQYILKDARRYGIVTPQFIEETLIEKFMRLAVMRMQTKPREEEERQLHLFDDCEDIAFHIKHGDGTIQKALGDFDEKDIEQVTQQKLDNIEAAKIEAKHWERAVNVVLPLLRAHPNWLWRDAASELRRSGLV